MITRRMFVVGAPTLLAPTLLLGGRTAQARTQSADALTHRFAAIEAKAGGRLGVAVLDTGTGVQAAWRGDERFPMCSTFKLLAVAAVLKRAHDGKETLAREILVPAGEILDYAPVAKKHAGRTMTLFDLCAAAMAWSDNTAANLILKGLGGPAEATAFVRSLGDESTRIDRMEPDANIISPGDPRDTTTPNAMMRDINRLVLGDGLSAQSREQLTNWLLANETGNHRLRAGLPKTWRVGDRTGTGPRGTSNDVGVAWPPAGAPIVIAAYLTGSPADRDGRDAVLADVGRAVAAVMG
jgi:beta-lactamase class A